MPWLCLALLTAAVQDRAFTKCFASLALLCTKHSAADSAHNLLQKVFISNGSRKPKVSGFLMKMLSEQAVSIYNHSKVVFNCDSNFEPSQGIASKYLPWYFTPFFKLTNQRPGSRSIIESRSNFGSVTRVSLTALLRAWFPWVGQILHFALCVGFQKHSYIYSAFHMFTQDSWNHGLPN